MTSDTILCQGCGITLRPFMNRCPRCGTARLGATEPEMHGMPTVPTDDEPVVMAPLQTISTGNTGALPFRTTATSSENAAPRTAVISFDEQRRRPPLRNDAVIAPPPNTVFMSPPDTMRRFPLLNPSQWMLLFAALALLILGLVVGYLLWSREQKDTIGTPTTTTNATLTPTMDTSLPSAAPTMDPLSASPTPELAPMVEGDQAVLAEVKKALAAFNPIYHSRYQVAIKDGVVTITGPADNQPEKDGVGNVLKLVAGVKGITNNLTVKADPTAAQGGLPMTAPTTVQTAAQTTAPTVTPLPENNLANQQAALEAERQRLAREAEAQRTREAEFNRQREADNQRLLAQRQREEEQRRQREEAERPRIVNPPPATATAAPRALRSGTVAWSGIVDGLDEIIIAGSSASVRHQSGAGVSEARAAFSAPVPRAPVAVQLVGSNGRGSIQIVQEPSAANGYTTIVRIDDSRENGGKPYQFTLRWMAQ